MIKDVYEYCPSIENDKYLIRLIKEEDLRGLYRVYSDKKAVPFFNSDNCNGDDFYYDTIEKMEKGLGFWLDSYYKWKCFVRYTIIDKKKNLIIGTIEAFHRDSNSDIFDNTCLVRLDLSSDYEKEEVIKEIFTMMETSFYQLFDASIIATKVPSIALGRKNALLSIAYKESFEPLMGPDGTKYYNYFYKLDDK